MEILSEQTLKELDLFYNYQNKFVHNKPITLEYGTENAINLDNMNRNKFITLEYGLENAINLK